MSVLNFVLALLPVLWLIIALSGLKMAGHKACLISLGLSFVLAIFYWRLDAVVTLSAAAEGILNALWPICLVIVAALFTYNLTLKTGAMELIKKMLSRVSRDKRVLALLIGWGFGCFMEGMAGFGTAVAIPASMLVGLGLDPIGAVVACLVVNSTPTGFGSVGVPTVTLASVTGLDSISLAGDVALLQCILTFISPFLMVCICGKGIKALKGMIPTTIIASLSFVIPWIVSAYALGAELPNILGSICSMGCIIMAARIFNKNADERYCIEKMDESSDVSLGEGIRAWSPFLLIFIFLLLTSNLCPPVHNAIADIKSQVVVYAGEGGNVLTFSWVNTAGIIIFVAAIIGGIIQGASAGVMVNVLIETLKKYWRTLVTICSVMAMAKIMSYSGMISDIATMLVSVTGSYYPFFAPMIGVLGAFVTGSGTSTSVLFGGLQSETAMALDLSPSWMAAANMMGAGIGKMICPQGIAIGAGATNAVGTEGKILGSVAKYCLFYVILAGILCYVFSTVL